MKIVKALSRKPEGGGYVLYGNPEGPGTKWFERWFATREKALTFARRNGWTVESAAGVEPT